MKILPFESSDLPFLDAFRPPGWSDLKPHYQYYLNSLYCHPIKVVLENTMAGIGATLLHADTAWLAHIIVHPDFRNRGLGTIITGALVKNVDANKYKTIFLAATPMGEPIYKKAGFESEAEYWFFKDGKIEDAITLPQNIVPFEAKYADEILALDKEVSGEDRSWRIKENLQGGLLYILGNKIEGYFLPTLVEGLIVAKNPVAGLELLRLKHAMDCITVIPTDNKIAIDFMEKNNFKVYRKAQRMRLGLNRNWRPDYIYSRVSGQIG